MKRLRWPEILTGALLAIAVFAVGYSVSSFRYSPSSETTYGKDHDIANFADVFVAIWDYLTKDAITLFTLVLAVSTVWLAASTRGLWRETLATRKLAVHTAFVYRVNMDVFGNFFEMTLPAVNPELHPIRLGVSDIA